MSEFQTFLLFLPILELRITVYTQNILNQEEVLFY